MELLWALVPYLFFLWPANTVHGLCGNIVIELAPVASRALSCEQDNSSQERQVTYGAVEAG